jgi:hypothetical protein
LPSLRAYEPVLVRIRNVGNKVYFAIADTHKSAVMLGADFMFRDDPKFSNRFPPPSWNSL